MLSVERHTVHMHRHLLPLLVLLLRMAAAAAAGLMPPM
jgi:hypothetical protein